MEFDYIGVVKSLKQIKLGADLGTGNDATMLHVDHSESIELARGTVANFVVGPTIRLIRSSSEKFNWLVWAIENQRKIKNKLKTQNQAR